MATQTTTLQPRSGRTRTTLLWTAQGLLAALFVMAGVSKFLMPAEALTAQSGLSVSFLRFIGVAEVLGAAGLILPGAFRVKRWLTPLAATGLVVIMIGAVVVSALAGGVGAGVFPGIVGVVLAVVVRGRRDWAFAGMRGERISARAVELAA